MCCSCGMIARLTCMDSSKCVAFCCEGCSVLHRVALFCSVLRCRAGSRQREVSVGKEPCVNNAVSQKRSAIIFAGVWLLSRWNFKVFACACECCAYSSIVGFQNPTNPPLIPFLSRQNAKKSDLAPHIRILSCSMARTSSSKDFGNKFNWTKCRKPKNSNSLPPLIQTTLPAYVPATHCNTLQHTATHCSHCDSLQHGVVHYNTLQRTAT